MDRGGHGGADQAVEPMVIRSLRPVLPLVDHPPSAFGLDPVLSRDVFGEEPVLLGLVAEQGQAASIAHRRGQAGMNERLPVVRVEDDVPDRPPALDVGNPPVVADPVTSLALVF